MHVRCTTVGSGPGPDEKIIAIQTANGHREEVPVTEAMIIKGAIDVGYPIVRELEKVLVELPRESFSGNWRIWVPVAAVLD